MQEKYEIAIKETFEYLNGLLEERRIKALTSPVWRLWELGLDRIYVITSQMSRKGFTVKCHYIDNKTRIIVAPSADSLPIHIWKEKTSQG